ncbi:BZ3500_MvSof-1268-A1-R1_Chr11-1g03246 [Microbotryum saponariae]|uniref:BZ3500_MvSof-1268-A1-R1_Chr11-1g03246 protein n=1 Tax=Microbotryum saponariae TaxID=289078 RepID=A0A2X0NFA7_9BASI|nr:BZ3501_MvSof-1269-A2-R1_Chr11g02821 [Microbotryum saponariae]SDA03807.1 BZ3500_MvSof-1268-A1-R1_Chr11-1g03246 [Microbotryum saponariae]
MATSPDKLKELAPVRDERGGIEGGPQRTIHAARWDDLTLLAFILLCIYLSLAGFQRDHSVGPSFLVIFALMIIVSATLHSMVLLGVALYSDNVRLFRSMARGMRKIRVAMIVNTNQVIWILMAMVSATASTRAGGCKNPALDEHAGDEAYTALLPPFCRNKRAGAVFFWLLFISWCASLGITIASWYRARRRPQSQAFTSVPGVHEPPIDLEREPPFESPYDVAMMERQAVIQSDGTPGTARVYEPNRDYQVLNGVYESSQVVVPSDAGHSSMTAITNTGMSRFENSMTNVTSPGTTLVSGRLSSQVYGRGKDPFADQAREERSHLTYQDPYEMARASIDMTEGLHQHRTQY